MKKNKLYKIKYLVRIVEILDFRIGILLFVILTATGLISCSKTFVIINHENPYSRVTEDLMIPPYDSSSMQIEFRLWVNGEFGLKSFYRFYYSKDSIWKAEKYVPYHCGRRNLMFVKRSFYEENKNKLLWTKKEKVLNHSWNFKWNKLKDLSIEKLSGADNYRDNLKDQNGDKIVIVVFGGISYQIEIFNNGFYNNYCYHNPESYIEYNKNNIELRNIIEIIKIITKEI
jgi:hypothetical protein